MASRRPDGEARRHTRRSASRGAGTVSLGVQASEFYRHLESDGSKYHGGDGRDTHYGDTYALGVQRAFER